MIVYLVTVSAILAACFAFYKLLLVKETFYTLNRFILLACLVLAFVLPFIPVPENFSMRKGQVIEVGKLPLSSGQSINEGLPSPNQKLSKADAREPFHETRNWFQEINWLSIAYLAGAAIFAVNFLIQIFKIWHRIYRSSIIIDGPYKIVEITADEAPCSIGNYILINPEKYDWETYCQVLLHEKIHIQQHHTLDILVGEIAKIILWFNPLAWKYRESIEDNLEFLTDNELIKDKKVEKNSYQLSLLKVSAPNFPLNVTTNYNQSLLKKRVSMMNAKRSNVHTTWKYLFLLPLMLVLMSFLNQPKVKIINKQPNAHAQDFNFEGNWFARIEGEKVLIQFRNDGNDNVNSNYFPLSQTRNGSFSIVRDAGTMHFDGKFEQGTGMGRYKFLPNLQFSNYLKAQQVIHQQKDLIEYYLVNVNRAYVDMLKTAGYTSLKKIELLSLAALDVDAEFIKEMKSSFGKVEMGDLVSLKAMRVSSAYIKEIKAAGYPRISAQQLIGFRAQGIDAKYISASKISTASTQGQAGAYLASSSGGAKSSDGRLNDLLVQLPAKEANGDSYYQYGNIKSTVALTPDQLIRIKEKVNSVSQSDKLIDKRVPINNDEVAAMNDIAKLNYSGITADEMTSLKSLRINLAYVKSFEELGFKDIPISDIIALKANNITAETVKGVRAMGFPGVNLGQVITLKALGITPTLVAEYRKLGYSTISIDDLVYLRSMRVTPEYIQAQKDKGYDFKDVRKYTERKTRIGN